MGTGCFLWYARRQTQVAIGTPGAEYYAASICGTDIISFRQLLDELGFSPGGPTPMRVDANSALANLTSNQVTHGNKHIKIRYHWIRQAIACKDIVAVRVDTKDNLADVFTKALPPDSHKTAVRGLGLQRASSR